MDRKERADYPTSILLTENDQANISRIQREGWATNNAGAIRFALKFTAEQLAAEKKAV